MKKAAALVVTAALLAAPPLAAALPMPQGQTFSTRVTLQQEAVCDGSVRFAPGAYKLQVVSMGDGSVRGSFFDMNGRKVCEAKGKMQIVTPGPPNSHATFSSLGFGENSRSTFTPEGKSLKLQVFSQDGTNQILIGLLLPAVQKVREAANKPH